jgi:hypothetical protein
MTICSIEVDNQNVINIELFDNSVSLKFLEQLKWHISNSSINNLEAFYGYADEKSVKSDLMGAIKQINSFLKREYIKLPSNANWDNHNIYNELHQYFEKLNSSWSNPSKLLYIAPEVIKQAIRTINFSVHRLEHRPYDIERTLYLSWDKNHYQRELLTNDEHMMFTNLIEPGIVYLNYVEVGKNLLDLYYDGLDPSYEAYENLHYVGAEVIINFDGRKNDLFTAGFRKWADKHNIDINDKTLGIGKIPIGRFSGSDKLFTKDSKITKIIIQEK